MTTRPPVDLQSIRYSKSPIVEVVCELRFKSDLTWNASVIDQVHARLQPELPKREILGSLETEVETTSEGFQQRVRVVERVKLTRQDDRAFA